MWADPGFEGGWLRLGGLLIAWIQRSLELLQMGESGVERLDRTTVDRGLVSLENIVFSHR